MISLQIEKFIDKYFDNFDNEFCNMTINTCNIKDFSLKKYTRDNQLKKLRIISMKFYFSVIEKLGKVIYKGEVCRLRRDSKSYDKKHNFTDNKMELQTKDRNLLKKERIKIPLPISTNAICNSTWFQVVTDVNYKSRSLNVQNVNNFCIYSEKRNVIHGDSLIRNKLQSQKIKTSIFKNKFKMSNDSLSMSITRPKSNLVICNSSSFDIHNEVWLDNTVKSSISNNFNYNFNYGFLPSLKNYEDNIKNYSPIIRKESNKTFTYDNIHDIENIYDNIKKDFVKLKPLLLKDKDQREFFFNKLSEGNPDKYMFYKNLFKLILNEEEKTIKNDKFNSLSSKKYNTKISITNEFPILIPKSNTRSISNKKFNKSYSRSPSMLKNFKNIIN